MDKNTIKSRLMSKIKKSKNGCWNFTGHISPYGYGQMWADGVCNQAHKLMYKLKHGSIPKGMVLLHKCNNRKCCNPAHLKLGTSRENNIQTVRDGRHKNQHSK